MHSKMYEKIKKFYEDEVWPIAWVRNAVGKKITPEQFKEITGEDYE